ncbi:MAG: ABC transporter ATP-binding protein [Actinobacteria bacterium]|nr:MAG: ABC transporter ATP-binding protein [Actinomycetota bacterium]
MREPEPRGLELHVVHAGYGLRPVLAGVSMRAEPGRVTGLIGPNGSGKTTLVRVASRGLRPSAGSVTVAGVDPYAVSARLSARIVGVVPQELAPAFEYTVLELVLMGRAPHRSRWGAGTEDWAHARRAMGAANVLHLADRPIGELSGGERQRAVLAQALAQDTPILLLDEPTTHLDIRHLVEILGLVRGLARDEGRTVLVIFHDLNLASAYCDEIVALSEGRVVAAGSPEHVITRGLVRDVFGLEADVAPAGVTGRPSVVLSPPVAAASPNPLGAPRAHVVGGAGRGASVMRALAERGFAVSTGVLHVGDTDAAVAERLNLLRISVPPFSIIDAASARDVRSMMAEASLVVVCDAPFGPGNVENLRAALHVARSGGAVALLQQVPIEERDFTGGEATALWRELASCATTYGSVDAVLGAVGPRD